MGNFSMAGSGSAISPFFYRCGIYNEMIYNQAL
jgi:hypothetical protein